MTYQVVKYILQLCYVNDLQAINQLQIPVVCGTLFAENIQKLPFNMNRPVCLVGYLKLLMLPQFRPLLENPTYVQGIITSAVDVIKNKRIIDFEYEEIKEDKTTNLSIIRKVQVDPELTTVVPPLKEALASVFSLTITVNGQQVQLRQVLQGELATRFNEIMNLQ